MSIPPSTNTTCDCTPVLIYLPVGVAGQIARRKDITEFRPYEREPVPLYIAWGRRITGRVYRTTVEQAFSRTQTNLGDYSIHNKLTNMKRTQSQLHM